MPTCTVVVTISSNTCHKCGAVYGLSDAFKERARREGTVWHCPHCQVGTEYSENETVRLKRELAQAQTTIERKEADVKWYSDRREEERKARKHVEAQRNGLRGALVRTKTRIKHGVCPCCNRTVSQLAAHMRTEHPHFQPEEGTQP